MLGTNRVHLQYSRHESRGFADIGNSPATEVVAPFGRGTWNVTVTGLPLVSERRNRIIGSTSKLFRATRAVAGTQWITSPGSPVCRPDQHNTPNHIYSVLPGAIEFPELEIPHRV